MMSDSTDSVQSRLSNEDQEKTSVGKVYLVGAGPGDPRLLTIRGRQCLEKADVVLYDGLANAQLLQYAPQAECVCVGKHGQQRIWTQAEINQRIVGAALESKTVVRLKGGDPAVFARTAEELTALRTNNIAFEVVPGITAALAAASYAGIPVTHRDHASAVAFVTGQQRSDERPQAIDWSALARFPGTLVFYMGVTTVEHWAGSLIGAGKPVDTPVAIVRKCSWSEQTVLRCQLGDVMNELTPASKMRPPVVVIVGEVSQVDSGFDWFSQQPLHGCGVLITRAEKQSASLADRLLELGADVFFQPMLTVMPPGDSTELVRAIAKIKRGDIQGVTFSSTNSVEGFFAELHSLGHDTRILSECRLAAVGPATADALWQYGVRADIVPTKDFSAAGLVGELRDSVAGEQWLVTKTNRSGNALDCGLVSRGAVVHTVMTYLTSPSTHLRPEVVQALSAGRIQLATVTSAAIAESTIQLLGSSHSSLKLVSLGERISQSLKKAGWPPSAQAHLHSEEALVAAVLQCWRQSSQLDTC